jgi:predicted metal-dependent hydrolase
MKIIRSKRKTIGLLIEQDGSLTVRAPLRFSRVKIERLISEKAGWIKERQEWVRLHSIVPHRYEDGELFYYLGIPYPLLIVDSQHNPLLLKDNFQLDRNFQSMAGQVFIAWYRGQARQVIHSRLPKLANRYQLSYNAIHITSARKRWGSCSSRGTLNFSWRLVMAPPEVIDYVITHELAHLKIHNHSSEFWNYIESLLPTWQVQRNWLKENWGKFSL